MLAVKRQGLTLIELMVVLVILGLIAGMTAVNYSNTMNNFRNKRTLQTVLGLDARARHLGIASGRPLVLQIDVQRNHVSLRYQDGRTLNSIDLSVAANSRIVLLDPFGKRVTGTFRLPITSLGTSPCYAMHVEHRGSQWMAGKGALVLSAGQSRNYQSIQEVMQWFQTQ